MTFVGAPAYRFSPFQVRKMHFFAKCRIENLSSKWSMQLVFISSMRRVKQPSEEERMLNCCLEWVIISLVEGLLT